LRLIILCHSSSRNSIWPRLCFAVSTPFNALLRSHNSLASSPCIAPKTSALTRWSFPFWYVFSICQIFLYFLSFSIFVLMCHLRQKSLPRAELSVQTSAGPVLSQLLLEQSISHARINDVLLPFVISMLDIDNDTIGLCYLAVLTDILHNLPPALLSTRIRQLSQLCLSKVNESQSTCRRVQGARLLGLLVTEMSAATIER
jgi:hypothetical protein